MFIGAVKNEIEKLYYKKRIHVVIGIILLIAILTAISDYFSPEYEDPGWRELVTMQIEDYEKQLETIEDNQSQQYTYIENGVKRLEYHYRGEY